MNHRSRPECPRGCASLSSCERPSPCPAAASSRMQPDPPGRIHRATTWSRATSRAGRRLGARSQEGSCVGRHRLPSRRARPSRRGDGARRRNRLPRVLLAARAVARARGRARPLGSRRRRLHARETTASARGPRLPLPVRALGRRKRVVAAARRRVAGALDRVHLHEGTRSRACGGLADAASESRAARPGIAGLQRLHARLHRCGGGRSLASGRSLERGLRRHAPRVFRAVWVLARGVPRPAEPRERLDRPRCPAPH